MEDMILTQPDEINAYRNPDGSWTIEGHNDKMKFIIPYASLEIALQGSIGSPLQVELKMVGTIENFNV